jgi:transcriptional regulator with XRE-family HTH domain
MIPQEATLGQRLRARRLDLGLTLAEVSEASKLSLPYISNLERGRGNPTIDALKAIAKALKIPLGQLMGTLEEGSSDVPLDIVLANAPKSLLTFANSVRFREVAEKLANAQNEDHDQMRRRLLVAMAAAPQRSKGESTQDDWRRLLDTFSLILSE